MSPFLHIRSDIPFLGQAGTACITAVMHVATTQPNHLLPTLHYWVIGIRTIPSATAHFQHLGYDIIETTLFYYRTTYENKHPLDPLQAEPLNYQEKRQPEGAATQQTSNMAGTSSPSASTARTNTPDPGPDPFDHPNWGGPPPRNPS